MDKLIELALSLKEDISSLDEYKEYIFHKQNYENSALLAEKRKQIAANINNKEVHDRLLSEYNNDPLVVNYNTSKEELYSVLTAIKNILV